MGGKAKGAAHVTHGGAGFRCMNCGDEQALAYPISIPVWNGAAKAYEVMHRGCKPSERGAARFRYTTPAEWLRSWDTGASSLTIFATFAGHGMPDRPDVPHDPADFGRCCRLLKVAPPEWRTGLARVAERFPAWRPLVERWTELEALYEEELPTGRAPRTYELMQAIAGAAS